MTSPDRIILQCNQCKKLYSVKPNRWEKLLKRWGNPELVVQNYVCRKCEYQISPPSYQERPSPEEIEALSTTIDGKPFNPLAVNIVIKKLKMVRKMWKYTKAVVVDEQQLQEHYKKWLEEKEKQEKQKQQQEQEQEQQQQGGNIKNG